MRFPLLVLLVLAACGGGNTPVQPNPPPPPPPPSVVPGPPASVAIQAGDKQDAEPGKAVAVRPSVVVKDAQGRALSGVGITFAVESGGGTVQPGSVNTAADGTAAPGSWTLGPDEGDNTLTATVGSLAAARFTAHGRFPTVQLVTQTVAAGGGTITYRKAGDPLDGLALTIPSGAYPAAGTWTIESKAQAETPGHPEMDLAAPVLIVTTDQGMASKLLTLKIPVRLRADSFATAFYFDPTTRALEPIPVAAADAGSITIAARHFSAGLLATPAAGSGLRSASAVNLPQLQIHVVGQAFALLATGPLKSDFITGTDDWEFGNHGSYVAPDGHAAGQAATALYHFYTYRDLADPLTRLFGRNARSGFWGSDPLGYRLASMAESDVDWTGMAGFVQQINNIGTAATGFNADQAHFFVLAEAIGSLKKPQLIMASGAAGNAPLIAYEISQNEVVAADPSHPGTPVRIPFVGGRFQPVQLEPMTGDPPRSYQTFRMVGVSALLNIGLLHARYGQFLAGTVGATSFPSYTLEYFDEDFGIWKTLPATSLSVSWQNIRFRATCSTCLRHIPGANPVASTALDVYDLGGTRLASDRTQGFVEFRVPAGNHKVGIHILGGRPSPGGGQTIWRHVDFRDIQVTSSSFYITPDPTNLGVNTPAKFTARNQAVSTARYSYFWTFDDGSNPQQITPDSNVTHAWTLGGAYVIRVLIKDVATGLQVARVSATVNVGASTPAWRIQTWKETGANGPVIVDLRQLSRFSPDLGFSNTLLGRPRKGVLFYNDTPVTSGSVSYPQGVILQAGITETETGLDASLPYRVLARAPGFGQPTISVGFPDALTVSGDLSSGTLAGRTVQDAYDWGGHAPMTALSTMDISSTKQGPGLSGRIRMIYWVYNTVTVVPNGCHSLACTYGIPNYLGDFIRIIDFTATRIR